MNNKDGFISLETVISLTALYMIFFLFLGMFVYITPIVTMPTYLYSLSNSARLQGGLTEDDIAAFKETINNNYNYINSNNLKDAIAIEAKTIPSNDDVSNIELDNESLFYASRQHNEVIVVKASIPSNTFFFQGVFNYFNIFNINNNYAFRQVVASERF